MQNTLVFDVQGVGQWTVAVDDGTVSVTEGAGEADCTISASEETLSKIAKRRGEPDDRLHDGQAQDLRRHGRRAEAAEAVLTLFARRNPPERIPAARIPAFGGARPLKAPAVAGATA